MFKLITFFLVAVTAITWQVDLHLPMQSPSITDEDMN